MVSGKEFLFICLQVVKPEVWGILLGVVIDLLEVDRNAGVAPDDGEAGRT